MIKVLAHLIICSHRVAFIFFFCFTFWAHLFPCVFLTYTRCVCFCLCIVLNAYNQQLPFTYHHLTPRWSHDQLILLPLVCALFTLASPCRIHSFLCLVFFFRFSPFFAIALCEVAVCLLIMCFYSCLCVRFLPLTAVVFSAWCCWWV